MSFLFIVSLTMVNNHFLNFRVIYPFEINTLELQDVMS